MKRRPARYTAIVNHRAACFGGCLHCDSGRCMYFLLPGDISIMVRLRDKWRCSNARRFGAFCGIHEKMVRGASTFSPDAQGWGA